METTKKQCSERVYPAHSFTGFTGYPCSKPAKHEEAGRWWCSIHAPSKVAEKRAKKAAEWRAQWEEKEAKAEQREAAAAHAKACVDAVKGIPHPEKLPELLNAVRVQVAAWKNYRDADPATVSFESVTEHLARIASATADVDAAYAALMGETP